jgi:hypothetical protein
MCSGLETLNAEDIQVKGTPLHCDKDSLISLYVHDRAAFFELERFHSAGSYLLIDPAGNQIVTSPGYCGGYISEYGISSILKPLISATGVDAIDFDFYGITRFLERRITDCWPFITPFKGIFRIPPGSIINYAFNKPQYTTYLRTRKLSFARAIEMSVKPLVKKKNIILMYSGGVDSTALYAALNSISHDCDFDLKVVSIDTGPGTNSTNHASYMAKKIGFDLDILEFGYPPKRKAVITYIMDEMKKDITNPLNPHHAFATTSYSGFALSGQNFDAMLTRNMLRPQIDFYSYLIYAKNYRRLARMLVRNSMFLSMYSSSNILRKTILNMIKPQIRDGFAFDNSSVAYLAGFASTGHPNIIRRNEYAKSKELANKIIRENCGRS